MPKCSSSFWSVSEECRQQLLGAWGRQCQAEDDDSSGSVERQRLAVAEGRNPLATALLCQWLSGDSPSASNQARGDDLLELFARSGREIGDLLGPVGILACHGACAPGPAILT